MSHLNDVPIKDGKGVYRILSCVWDDRPHETYHQKCGVYVIKIVKNGRLKPTKYLGYFYGGKIRGIYLIPKEPVTFTSPFVNYQNLIYTGGWQYPLRDYDDSEEILQRVLDGKKLVGQTWSWTDEKVNEWLGRRRGLVGMGSEPFGFHLDMKGSFCFLSIYKKGILGNLLDLRAIQNDYVSCGLDIDFSKYSRLDVGEAVKDGVSVPNRKGMEEMPLFLQGLLFGYPIETTI
ncbi:hypothetical protein HK104_004892, partial [Borealophlyctis nickersoniae]